MSAAGRTCPVRYRYGATAIDRAPLKPVETLYVIGGLYGNLPALDAIEAMCAREQQPVTLCFNGDFNWFNVDDAGFRAVNERVLRHDAILGNVEAELQATEDAAGCGCAYPDEVDAATVERSNRIHARLKQTAAQHPDLLAALDALPMFARYTVGSVRVGVVHGDAESLAGWRFDTSLTQDITSDAWLQQVFAQAEVDVFASTHTCLPVMRDYGNQAVINNGSAGMPNYSDTHYGLLTRISMQPAPVETLGGVKIREVYIDALPIHFDVPRWLKMFDSNWPRDSDAWMSYNERIRNGPPHALPAR